MHYNVKDSSVAYDIYQIKMGDYIATVITNIKIVWIKTSAAL